MELITFNQNAPANKYRFRLPFISPKYKMLQDEFTKKAPFRRRGNPTALPRQAVASIPPPQPTAHTEPERIEGNTAEGGTNLGLFPFNTQYTENAARDARNVPAY